MARALPLLLLAAVLLIVVLARSFEADTAFVGPSAVEAVGAADIASTQALQADAPAPVVPDEARLPDGYPPEMILASRPSTQPGRVSGVVLGGRDGATPLLSASVGIRRWNASASEEQRCVTDASGRFAISDVEPAALSVTVAAESHGGIQRATLLPRENTGIELEIVVPVWRDMTIRLVGPDGPIRDFRTIGLHGNLALYVSVRTGPADARDERSLSRFGGPYGPRPHNSNRSHSESLGRFELGAYVLPTDVVHVLLGRRVIASRPLPGDERVADFPVTLDDVRRASVPAEVRIVASGSRRPIAGAVVQFRTVSNADLSRMERTDASGTATWKEAPPIGFHLRALADGFVPRTGSIEAARDGATELELDSGHCLAGRISAPRGDIEVSLRKRPPDRELLGPTVASARTNPRGEFDFGTIVPGEYVVAAADAKPADLRGSDLASASAYVLVTLTARDVVDVLVPWGTNATGKRGPSPERGRDGR